VTIDATSDCEDDDPDSHNIRRLLAATTRLLRVGESASTHHPASVHSACLPRLLLVRHE